MSTLFVALASVAGCTGLLGGDPTASLRTDASLYAAKEVGDVYGHPIYEIPVVVKFTNHSNRPLYLGTCGPGSTRPRWHVDGVGPSEPSAFDPVWGCTGGGSDLEVLPGASRVDTLLLRGPSGFDGVTHEPFGVLEGRFRIVYHVYTCRETDLDCILRDVGPSNTFEIRVP